MVVSMLDLPPDMSPGGYKLATGLYTEPLHDRLTVIDMNGQSVPENWITLENHRIPLPAMPMPGSDSIAIKARFGGMLSLDAFSVDLPLSALRPGNTVHLRQFWHTVQAVDRSYTIFVHVVDKNGNIVAQQDIQPFSGRYPTNVWSIGEPITVDFTLTLPSNAPVGPYEWRVGAYSFPSLERLTVIQDGQSIDDRRAYLRSPDF